MLFIRVATPTRISTISAQQLPPFPLHPHQQLLFCLLDNSHSKRCEVIYLYFRDD